VEQQLKARGICNPRVLRAMKSVERELFIPKDLVEFAYTDAPLPIDENQTISQPYMVALMTAELQLQGSEKVLEIGTGSGYQAAILGYLAAEVHTVERFDTLAQSAWQALRQLRLNNVHVHVGDGTRGWPEAAPYDAVIVTAAAPDIPEPLKEQLADQGRLIAPVGDRGIQNLTVVQRDGEKFKQKNHESCVFVPLIGEYGWPG